MICSANELEMLAQKAARGGGAFPAQAAHFGKAVTRHVAAGRTTDTLIAALKSLPSGPIQTLPIQDDLDPNDPLHQSYCETNPLPVRLTCPQGLYDVLAEFAARIYVPETEDSRLGGAGAGLTDND